MLDLAPIPSDITAADVTYSRIAPGSYRVMVRGVVVAKVVRRGIGHDCWVLLSADGHVRHLSNLTRIKTIVQQIARGVL